MTCIVGLVNNRQPKKSNVYMGADSAGVSGLDITIRKDTKLFRNGPFLIGCTSSFRMIQLLRFSLSLPEIDHRDSEDYDYIYRYMCTSFVDRVRDTFRDGGFLQTYKAGDEKGGNFLVAYKEKLFSIEGDFQVGEPSIGFASCGCGQQYALGSLYSTQGDDPESRVRGALDAAQTFSAGVSEPFNIKCTE